MGTIRSLEQARRRRQWRRNRAAALAPLHPSLRWETGDGYAHRRRPHAGTACGQQVALTLADADAPLCPACYPGAAR